MREYWGSGYGGTGGGGGGGGGGSTKITLTAGESLDFGDVVTADASGEAVRANTDISLVPQLFFAIGAIEAPVLAGGTAAISSNAISKVPMRFGSAPLVTDNGKPVYLSTVPGEASLAVPGAGHAVVRLGTLCGADGVDTTPHVLLNIDLVAIQPL